MAYYLDIHPINPQQRLLDKLVERLRLGQIAAIPTDSGYALICTLGNKEGLERIRNIRQVGAKHHFTLLCKDFAQLGKFVIVDNKHFRLIKTLTPGAYTFILKATKEVPKMTLHPKKSTVGVRIPQHTLVKMLLDMLDEPLISSSLILPNDETPQTEGWVIAELLEHVLDVVVAGEVENSTPTTVVDFSAGDVEILRRGGGATELLE